MKRGVVLDKQELLILQELMNIAFGSASADLEEILELSIDLHVPDVQVVAAGELKTYIKKSMNLDNKSLMVEEKFWGEFSGSSILVFPGDVGQGLISILSNKENELYDLDLLEEMDKGALLEIGNILIGACIGKISELLNTSVTYSPPYIESGGKSDLDFFVDKFEHGSSVIILKTRFVFNNKKLTGRIMIITNQDSLLWMKEALQQFMDSYK